MGRRNSWAFGSHRSRGGSRLSNLAALCSCTGSVIPASMLVALLPAAGAALLQWRFPGGSMSLFGEEGGMVTAAPVWTGFTTLLGFLVVFRTSQSYARWWEGCSACHHMRAEWFDAILTLCTFADHSNQPKERTRYFKRLLVRLGSLLQATALAELERGQDGSDLIYNYEVIAPDDLDSESVEHFRRSDTKVELVYGWVLQHIMDGTDQGVLPVPPPILTRAFQELGTGFVHYHDALKLAVSPFPFAYAQTCDGLLLIHLIIAPFITSQWTTHSTWAALFTFIQVFVLYLLNFIAGELTNPFGPDANDVNGAQMQVEMNHLLKMVLEPEAERAPKMHGGWEDIGSLDAADSECYKGLLNDVIHEPTEEAAVQTLSSDMCSAARTREHARSLNHLASFSSVRRLVRGASSSAGLSASSEEPQSDGSGAAVEDDEGVRTCRPSRARRFQTTGAAARAASDAAPHAADGASSPVMAQASAAAACKEGGDSPEQRRGRRPGAAAFGLSLADGARAAATVADAGPHAGGVLATGGSRPGASPADSSLAADGCLAMANEDSDFVQI